MNRTKTCFVACWALLFSASATSNVHATTFTIDSSLSSLSIFVGLPDPDADPPALTVITTPQALGSDTTSIAGTLDATLGLGTITFAGTPGEILFANQPTDMIPGPGGVLPGMAPANYGLLIDLSGIVAGPGAIRGMTASLGGGPSLVIGDDFSSAGLVLGISAGGLDINLTGFTTVQQTVNLAGNNGANLDPAATLTVAGSIATLYIPLHVEAIIPVEPLPGVIIPLTAVFTGQIVATAIVPEPGSMALLGIGAVGLVVVQGRSRRRSRT